MRVLTLTHGLPPTSIGGAERAAFGLACALAPRHEVTVVAPGPAEGQIHGGWRRRQERGVEILEMLRAGGPPTRPQDGWRCDEVERSFDALLRSRRFDVCHVHHLTGLSMALPVIAARRGLPVVMTFHDAWMVCGRGQLLDLDLRLCEGPTPQGCGRCLADQLALGQPRARIGQALRGLLGHAGQRGQQIWGLLERAALERATGAGSLPGPAGLAALSERLELARGGVAASRLLTAPSRDLLARLARAGLMPGLEDRRVRVMPNLPPSASSHPTPPPPPPLRVVFVGALIPTKGLHVLLEALGPLPPDRVQLTVIGPSPPFHRAPGYADRLRATAPAHVQFLGPLPPNQVEAQVARSHLLALPSLWPENAPLVISEALAAGVPVLASKVGGVAEMVREGVEGLLLPPGDVSAWRAALADLSEGRGLAPLQAGARRWAPPATGQVVEAWEHLLEEAHAG